MTALKNLSGLHSDKANNLKQSWGDQQLDFLKDAQSAERQRDDVVHNIQGLWDLGGLLQAAAMFLRNESRILPPSSWKSWGPESELLDAEAQSIIVVTEY